MLERAGDDPSLSERRAGYERSLQLAAVDPTAAAMGHRSLGDLDRLAGDEEAALAHIRSAIRIGQELGDPHVESDTWQSLAGLHASRGRLDDAAAAFDAAAACLARES